MEKNKKIKKGFTLVEIVIVIAVIAILAAVLLPVFSSILENARRTKAFSEIVSVKNDYFASLDDPTTNMQDFVFVVGDYVYGIDETGNWIIIDFDEDYTLVGVIGNVSIYEKEEIIELLEPGLYETGSETMICSWNDLIRNNLIEVVNDEITDYLVTESGDLYVHHDIESIQVNVFNATQNPSANYLTGISFGGDIETIQQNAFYGCQNLQFIAFRDSKASHAVAIEDLAFYGCSALELKDSLPVGLVKLGKSAFASCNSITEVTIPSTLVNIDDFAFENCYSLEKIIIPEGVTYLDKAFINCHSLKEIVVSKNNYVYYSDGKALYKSDSLILYANMAAKEYTVLESVDLNNAQVQTISTISSKKRPSMLSTTIAITNIGESAFKGCDNLTKVTLPTSLKTISEYAFYNCGALASLQIPSNLEKIGGGAFQECDSLTEINLGEKVEQIGTFAFANCNNLKTVKYKDGLQTIGASAFEACGNLETFVFDGTQEALTTIGSSAFKNDSKLNMTVLPQKVQQIGDSAFYGCSMVKTTNLPETLSNLGTMAFARTGITQITINQQLKQIGSNVFESTNLGTINFNATNLSTSGEAFRDTASTFNLVVDSNVKQIGTKLFSNSKVANITFNTETTASGDLKGIQTICDSAFANCSHLKVLNLPDTLLTIESSAFVENYGLNIVKLGKNLESINSNAFAKCYRLVEIYDMTERLANPITLAKTTNGHIAYYALKIHTAQDAKSILVEDVNTGFVFACLEDKCYAINYVGGNTIVSVPDTCTYSGEEKQVTALRYTFFQSNVQSVTVPDSVNLVDQYSFYNCLNLKSLTLSQNIEFIEK
ncbi:MAG: leucine-rich repeat domain-containing protein, partial [Clostridia bacterium]|nr:leucine-rich repeat domain-containing protein [Clostridia bacterium]